MTNENWFCLEWGSCCILDGKFHSALLLTYHPGQSIFKRSKDRVWLGAIPQRTYTGHGSFPQGESQEFRCRNWGVSPQLLCWWWTGWWMTFITSTPSLSSRACEITPMTVTSVPTQLPREGEPWWPDRQTSYQRSGENNPHITEGHTGPWRQGLFWPGRTGLA